MPASFTTEARHTSTLTPFVPSPLDFCGPTQPILFAYVDDSPELAKALEELGTANDSSTPGVPRTNGVAERQVQEVVAGTRTMLLQGGLPACFWVYAMRAFCFARNIDCGSGDSAWNRRHKKGHFKGPIIRFGARVDFLPSPTTKQKESKKGRIKYAPASRVGVFLGYRIMCGGRWRGGFLVAELANFQQQDLSYFAKSSLKKVHVQKVRECELDLEDGACFPLRKRYDECNRTLEGIELGNSKHT